jgi:hypothetical protein
MQSLLRKVKLQRSRGRHKSICKDYNKLDVREVECEAGVSIVSGVGTVNTVE